LADDLANGWQRLNRDATESQVQASRTATVITAASRFMRQALQIAMLATGVWLVIDQRTTAGVMIAATILLGRALAPVEIAIGSWKGLVDARSAYGRLRELFALAPNHEIVTELSPPVGALSIERAVFGFRGHDRPLIKGPSFAVGAGDALAIVGPSASGKSTLARLIVGVWKPLSGAVRLDGADIAAWPRERIGRYIGYLPQEVELFAGTVSQNIARMGEIDSAAVIKAAQRANAHEFTLRLPQGYDTQIGDGGGFLSGGQRQRVALARALYGEPRLVVLDEPNSGLDIEGEEALLQAIRRLKTDGVTVVIITHRNRLLSLMDRILVLREGLIEKFAAPAELLKPVSATAGYPPVVAGQILPRT